MMADGKWDRRFFDLALNVATWSKDRSRKCGTVMVDKDRVIKATGYNGFPRGINDEIESRHQRPAKYLWTEHGERNAIYSAARTGTSLEGCTAYVPWYPCADCARAMIQSGIARLVTQAPDYSDAIWGEQFKVTTELLQEAGINVKYMPGEAPKAVPVAPSPPTPESMMYTVPRP